MIYFDEKMMVEGKFDYECEFLADLLHTCNNILIPTSQAYRNKNVLLEVKILSEKNIKTNEKRLNILDKNTDEFNIIDSDIEKWKSMIEPNNKSIEQIEELYKYKIEAYNNPDEDIILENNIPVTVVIKILDFDININEIGKTGEKGNDEIQIEKLIIRFANKINNKYFFSYNSVNSFLVALNIESVYDLKMNFNHILLCTEKIYENYIKIIEDYKDSIIYKLSLDNTRIRDDAEKKSNKKYEGKIEHRDEKIKTLKSEIKKKDKEIEDLMQKLLKLENKNLDLDSDLENQAEESEIDI